MKNIIGMAVVFCLLAPGIIIANPGDKQPPIPVYVSILPQADFVERIGGNRVIAEVLIPPGKSPATYSLTPAQMSALAKARVYFRIGVPFENALIPKIKNGAPHTLVVDTRKGVRLRTMESGHHHEGEEELHGMEAHHDEGNDGHEESLDEHAMGKDPHIWLDPLLVKIQAQTICQTLIHLDPPGKDYYQANLEAFVGDLNALHGEIAQALAPVKGSTVFVFHPSYGYLCDAFGLRQLAIELEGKTPKGKDLAAFIARAKKENVRVIFVQPQFDRNAAEKIAKSINGAVITMDPLAGDYFVNMKNMAKAISRALEQ
ncbi:MAG: zinc ABC transporter substrate-binding protein [Desulfatibacillum sp.]|nr:zinc ABC transporter substrate-binding protein [Desulfatibacillum sp.]